MMHVSGSAVAGEDYLPVGSTGIQWLRAAIYQTQPLFTVTILVDNITEGEEYFEVFFHIGFNGFPAKQVARVVIIDD